MDGKEDATSLELLTRERRAHNRQAVDEEATLLIVSGDSPIKCKIEDLSLEGCRLHMLRPFPASLGAHVEVTLRIQQITFRFHGVTTWTDDRQAIGIHFSKVPVRRLDEWSEVVGEVTAKNAAKAARQAAAEHAAALAQTVSPPETATKSPAQDRVAQAIPVALGASAAPAHVAKTYPARERREQSRHSVNTDAAIFLVNVGSKLHGRILDLSPNGCHIRTDSPFPVGIYTRVETEFHLAGLPFRLGGVTQAIHDSHDVGIRFLDMSQRKREQVEQLIGEIEETRAAESSPSHGLR